MKSENIFSPLDTKRFGIKVGKTDGSIFRENPKDVFGVHKDQGYKLLIARVSMNEIDLINSMEDLGFRIKDSQITYRYLFEEYNAFNTSFKNSEFVIRGLIESDIDPLVQLSKECFDNYGHYFANPRLDREKCREIYGDWTYNSCTDPNVADKIFVASAGDTPIGYLSFKIFEKDKKRYAAGGMGAVDIKYRGNNVFPNLILAGLEWGASIGLDWEEHNTLVNNLPVNRSMIKMGFKSSNHMITMHCWLSE